MYFATKHLYILFPIDKNFTVVLNFFTDRKIEEKDYLFKINLPLQTNCYDKFSFLILRKNAFHNNNKYNKSQKQKAEKVPKDNATTTFEIFKDFEGGRARLRHS